MWISIWKNKHDPYLTPYTHLSSEWIFDLNVIPKAIKIFKENIGENLCDLEMGRDFLEQNKKMNHKRKSLAN